MSKLSEVVNGANLVLYNEENSRVLIWFGGGMIHVHRVDGSIDYSFTFTAREATREDANIAMVSRYLEGWYRED